MAYSSYVHLPMYFCIGLMKLIRKVLLCSPGWSGTHCVDNAGLELAGVLLLGAGINFSFTPPWLVQLCFKSSI